MLPNMFQELEANKVKRSDIPWSSDIATFKLTNEAHALMIEHSVLSAMAGLIEEILFRAVLCS